MARVPRKGRLFKWKGGEQKKGGEKERLYPIRSTTSAQGDRERKGEGEEGGPSQRSSAQVREKKKTFPPYAVDRSACPMRLGEKNRRKKRHWGLLTNVDDVPLIQPSERRKGKHKGDYATLNLPHRTRGTQERKKKECSCSSLLAVRCSRRGGGEGGGGLLLCHCISSRGEGKKKRHHYSPFISGARWGGKGKGPPPETWRKKSKRGGEGPERRKQLWNSLAVSRA